MRKQDKLTTQLKREIRLIKLHRELVTSSNLPLAYIEQEINKDNNQIKELEQKFTQLA